MARALAKKTAADNEKILQNMTNGMIASSGIFVLLRVLLPPRQFPPPILPLSLYILTGLPMLFLHQYLRSIGTPKRDSAGTLISAGEDLSAPGLIEYCWDVIYVTWACQVGSSLFGDLFWWFYLSIPLYGCYKAYTLLKGPMGFGSSASTQAEVETASDPKESVSKRQAKIQKRNEKVEKAQAAQSSGRR